MSMLGGIRLFSHFRNDTVSLDTHPPVSLSPMIPLVFLR